MARREHVSNFDRFWNSTFGLPQQYVMRLLRVMQDDRVDLFSKRGLFDMSLVPGLGIFDDDRYDVGTHEKFDRTLGRLGVKRSLGAELGVELFTDPLTYLTGGLTAAGKAAQLANRARNLGVIKRGLKDVDILGGTVGSFREHIGKTLQGHGGILAKEQRTLLEKTDAALADMDAALPLQSFLEQAGKREIQIGLPILNGYGAVLHRNPAYEGWTRFLLDKSKASGVAASMLAGTKGMVSGIPVLNEVLKGTHANWIAFRDGLGSAPESLRVFKAEGALPTDFRPPTALGREIYLSVTKRGADKVKDAFNRTYAEMKGKDIPGKSWAAVGSALGKKKAGAIWEEITGRAVTESGIADPASFAAELDKFMAGYGESVKHMTTGAFTDAVTPAGKLQVQAAAAGKVKLFDAGRRVGEILRKGFTSDTVQRSFDDATRNLRSSVAFYQQAVEEHLRTLVPLRAAAAAELGMDPQAFDAATQKLHEAHALQDELNERLAMLALDPQSKEAAQSLEEYASRYIATLSGLRKMATEGKANPFYTQILASLEPVFKEGLRDGDTLRAVMDGVSETVEKWAPEMSALSDSYGKYQLLTGTRKGKFLQFVPSEILRDEARRIKGLLDADGLKAPKRVELNPVDAPRLAVLAGRLGITEERALSLVQRGGSKAKRPDGSFASLSDVDRAEAKALRERLEATPAAKREAWESRETLAADMKAIKQVLSRRKSGDSKFTKMPRPQQVKFPHAARRMNSLGVERESPGADLLMEDLGLGEDQAAALEAILGGGAEAQMVDTGEAVHNALSLVLLAKEMKRAAAAGTTIAPDLHRWTTDIVARNSEIMEQAFHGAAGEAGKTYLKALDVLRGEIHAGAVESGLLVAGSPAAYSPRVKGFKEAHLLDSLLNDGDFYQVIETAMPRLGPLIKRNRDMVTVQDLNVMSRALADAAGPRAAEWSKTLDQFAVANGYKAGFQEYSEEALLNLMNRYAQGERVKTTTDYAARMFAAGEREGTLFGARVVAKVDAAGHEIPVGKVTRFTRAKNKGEEVTVGVQIRDETTPEVSGFVVELSSGKRQVVSAETLALHRGTIVGLGKPNLARRQQIALEVGDDTSALGPATAFAHLAAKGQISSGALANTMEDALRGIEEGDFVVFGNRDAISNTLATIQNQWVNSGPVLNAYDAAHHFVKRMQTVYRPAFMGANTVGAFAQSMLAGASPAAAARGYWHAARFMSENAELSATADRFAHLAADEKGIRGAVRGGTEFLRVLKRNPDLKGWEGADEVAFKLGEQEFAFRELAPHLRPLLLSTGTREGLRGGSRVSKAISKLGEGKPMEGPLAAVDTALIEGAELVETYNRLTTFFALVDDGFSLDRAGVNALAAHVDYSALTTVERTYFKRLFGFYTWSRKMTPYVFHKFVDDPSLAARGAALMRSDVIEEDENGNLAVHAGKFRAMADRFNPSLDTLRLLEVVGESMLAGVATTGIAREADRQEQIAGQTRPPLTAGGLTGVVAPLATGDGDGFRQMAENARDVFWLNRILLGAATGDDGERTMTEQIFEQMVPVKLGDGRERAKKTIQWRTNRVVGDLRRRAEQTTDLDLKARLYGEIERLKEYAASLTTP